MAAKEEMVAARLAGLTAGPGLSGPRAAARARLAAMGLPGRRDEYWRWTDPAALNAVTPAPATAAAEDEAPLFDALDRLKIVFVDGVFDAAASDDLALSGVEIARIADKIPGWAEALYGTLEAAGRIR